MRIAILGAGPAGLYTAYLLKKHSVASEVAVFEQNPPDATFGFGVVFSDRALEFLREDDPETHALIAPELETWEDITLNHPDRTIRIDGIGFAAIGRLHLLTLLQERAADVGVRPAYRHAVADISELDGFDLIVGADGANSLVRRSGDFGFSQELLSNRFVWYGTTKRFDTLTQTFKQTAAGSFNAHHYRYSPEMSTFIAEVDEATFAGAGFDRLDEAGTKTHLEEVFRDELDGHPLITNKSVWRQFPKVRNARWSDGNKVLVGDALRTAHFSIGSGTRLALEDAIALVRAFDAHRGDLAVALRSYEASRRPIVEKLVRAADASAHWYEDFATHVAQDAWPFAMSYITRSGRIDPARLAEIAPRFAAEYRRQAGTGS